MLCPLTASLTAFYTAFVNMQLFFEAIHVLFDGRNGDQLLGMCTECFGAFLVVGVFKMLIWMVQKWRKIGIYQQSQDSVLLGLVTIAFSSIAGKIFIREILEDHSTTAGAVLFVNCFHFSYFLLIHNSSKHCCWREKPASRTYEVLLVLLVFLNAGYFVKEIIDVTGHKNPQAFLIAQFCYSLILASSTCDILGIMMGRLEESPEFQQNGCVIEVKDAVSSSAEKSERFQQKGCVKVKHSDLPSAVLIPTRSIL